MDDIPDERPERFQSVDRRRPEARRAGVCVVAADRRHLANLEAESRSLDQHLRVEHEVIAVLEKWNRLEESTRVGPVPGVVLREMQTKDTVFCCGQEPIAEPLPPGHACTRRVQTEPAR